MKKQGPGTRVNLLVFGDSPQLTDLILRISGTVDCELHTCGEDSDLFELIKARGIDILITDIGGRTESGMSLLDRIRGFDARLDVIVVGDSIPPDSVVELVNRGAKDYLEKPLRFESLRDIFLDILDKKALRQETFRLESQLGSKYRFHDIIGKSPYMLDIFSMIEKIAKYFTSILITGETGTGKEMAARAIHDLSQTPNRKLVLCDCTSIPDNLFESELFGYVKGAFTGADKDRKGLFEEAHQGVIFLDELGEIPVTIQSKLLRVLEHHQFRPLGSNAIRKVDVRIIAATNQDLQQNVKAGTFREDLFHRLNKVEIHLPPLRERREDIPLLVRHFLGRFQRRFDREIKGISRQVQMIFLKYDWPGNVRELENVLERASMMTRKAFIDIQDLPESLQQAVPAERALPFIDRDKLPKLDDLEKEYIIHLLKLTGKNLRKTAMILNISRTTLYSKLKKYGIPY